MAEHMIVSHLNSSKSERCAVKFSKMFLARYKGKNLIFKIKLLLKFFELEMNQSNAWQKSKQQIMIRISWSLLIYVIDHNRDIMSNASSRCSNCMQIHKCELIEENEERPLEYLPWIYDSWSFFTVICSPYGINSHFIESLFTAKFLLETCTSLDIARVCLWKSFL